MNPQDTVSGPVRADGRGSGGFTDVTSVTPDGPSLLNSALSRRVFSFNLRTNSKVKTLESAVNDATPRRRATPEEPEVVSVAAKPNRLRFRLRVLILAVAAALACSPAYRNAPEVSELRGGSLAPWVPADTVRIWHFSGEPNKIYHGGLSPLEYSSLFLWAYSSPAGVARFEVMTGGILPVLPATLEFWLTNGEIPK